MCDQIHMCGGPIVANGQQLDKEALTTGFEHELTRNVGQKLQGENNHEQVQSTDYAIQQ